MPARNAPASVAQAASGTNQAHHGILAVVLMDGFLSF